MLTIITRSLTIFALLLLLPTTAASDAYSSLHKINEAIHYITQAAQFRDKYLPPGAPIEPPAPARGNSGKYMSPRNADGSLTPWATKAVQAAAGSAAGAKAGDAAVSQIAGQVPVVGALFGGFAKKKAQQQGAIMAIGGWDFIRSSSQVSFNSLDDLAVWLNITQPNDAQQAQAVSAAMDVYPKLKKRWSIANKKAFQKAGKAAKKNNR